MFNRVWCWNDNGIIASSYMVACDYWYYSYYYWYYLACLLEKIYLERDEVINEGCCKEIAQIFERVLETNFWNKKYLIL